MINFEQATPDKNPMLTPEGRAEELDRMLRCTQASMEIFGTLLDSRVSMGKAGSMETAVFTLERGQVMDILAKYNFPRLADWRMDEIGTDLAKALREFGPEACGASWFAHMLQHDIYDPDLKRNQK